jgi:PAS domain S-box-containing protein
MHWQPNPYLVPLLLSALVSGAVAAYALRHRRAHGALSLAAVCLCAAAWSLAYAGYGASRDPAARLWLIKLLHLAAGGVPVAWLAAVLVHTGRGRHLRGLAFQAVCALAAAPLLLALTNELHGFFFRSFGVREMPDGTVRGAIVNGPAFHAHVWISWLILSAAVSLLAAHAWRTPRRHRARLVALLMALCIPWLGNVLWYLQSGLLWVNPMPFLFTISGVVLGWAILRRRLMQVVPIARAALVDGMTDGVVVLDADGTVLDLNPSARRILGVPEGRGVGEPGREVLEPLGGAPRAGGPRKAEIGGRVYQLSTSLVGERGRAGQLVVLADVTEMEDAHRASAEESEERFRTVVESLGESLVITDLEDRVLYANSRTHEITGYAPEELVGRSAYQTFVGGDGPELRERIARRLQGIADSYELQLRRKDGSQVWTQVIGTPFRNSRGEVVGTLGAMMDITQRKTAEEAIRASEASYRAIFDLSHDAIYVLDPETGRILDANRQACRAHGAGADALRGLHLAELSADGPDVGAADAAEPLRRAAGGEPQRFEWLARDGRGGPFWAEVNVQRVPIGGAERLLATARDITGRKQAEAALQRAYDELERRVEERTAEVAHKSRELEAVFRALPDLYFRLDPEGRVVDHHAGESQNLYVPPEVFRDRRLVDLLPPEVAGAVAGGIAEVQRTGTLASVEYSLPLEAGTRDFEARLLPFGDSGLITVVRDITDQKAAERALQRSEEHFRALIENGSDLITILDEQGRFRYNSPSVRRILGHDPERLVGMDSLRFMHRDDVDEAREALAAIAAAPGTSRGVEFRYRGADGRWRVLEGVGRTLSPDGVAEGIVVNSRDVSRRKQAEAALRESEERFRLLAENGSDLAAIMDPDGSVRYHSPSSLRVLGFTPEEMAGGGAWEQVHPDDLEACGAALRAAVLAPGTTHSVEWRFRRRDGSYCWLESMVKTLLADSAEAGVVVNSRDVTDRRHAAEALRTAQAVQEALLNNIPDMAWLKDDRHRVLAVNQAVALAAGTTREFCTGKTDFEIWPPDVAAKIREDDERVLREGRQFVTEEAFLHPDGTEHYLETVKQPFHDGAGRIVGTVGIARDITERKRTEQALQRAKDEAERANRAKSEFLSRMSHELRTPMNSILGFGQVLARHPLTPEQKKGVDHILRAGRHLLNLINEVLDIARIESGRQPLALEPVPAAAVVREALALIRPVAVQHGVELASEVERDAPWQVSADRQRLTQVLLNLLSNAVKYNRAGGSVRVTCDADDPAVAGARVRIAVHDTGPGIPADRMDQLFRPFARLGAEETGVEGTGLGLALSKPLIEAMGGTIMVRTAEGEGSVFTLDLPRVCTAPGTPEPDPADGSEPAPAADGAGVATVLYIEDNVANLSLIEAILDGRSEITLHSALQGRLGLELAAEHRPDLILLDLHLPDLPGEEVLRRLRADPRTRDIPVIVISADATAETVKRLVDAGVRAYLTKPLDVDQFLDAVDGALAAAPEPR